MDSDYLLALKLSEQLNSIKNVSHSHNMSQGNSPKRKRIVGYGANHGRDDLNTTSNLVHPDWETIDPTPDIYTMFGAFDLRFFQGKLQCVSLEWSTRMYNCAGICYSRKNNFGMQCTIRLSEPLLKLRPRKDLVETLLHEMIHAYLFIRGIREGNGGHGPNFKQMMHGINRAAGTNITVYHTFHNEVNLYRTHWWRCNGICQHRKPFYGYVKRVHNRAPGPHDSWWSAHVDSCSGTFEKIKEPKNSLKRKTTTRAPTLTTREVKANNATDIRKFFPTNLVTPTQNSPTSTKSNHPNYSDRPGGNLTNVVRITDLDSSELDTPDQSPKISPKVQPFFGKGRSLSDLPVARQNDNVNHTVRDLWSKRFADKVPETSSDSKRPKLTEDDDLILIEEVSPIIDLLDSDEEQDRTRNRSKDGKNQSIQEMQDDLLKEIKHSTTDYDEDETDDDEIRLIDGDFDDTIIEDSNEIIDKNVMDDLFGEDTLLSRFQTTSRTNDVVCVTENNMIQCPLCQIRMARNELEEHLEGCLGVQVQVKHIKYKPPSKLPFYKNKKITGQVTIEDEEPLSQPVGIRSTSVNAETICPVCNKPQQDDINAHLDVCLITSFE